jgi:hypothetical protein
LLLRSKLLRSRWKPHRRSNKARRRSHHSSKGLPTRWHHHSWRRWSHHLLRERTAHTWWRHHSWRWHPHVAWRRHHAHRWHSHRRRIKTRHHPSWSHHHVQLSPLLWSRVGHLIIFNVKFRVVYINAHLKQLFLQLLSLFEYFHVETFLNDLSWHSFHTIHIDINLVSSCLRIWHSIIKTSIKQGLLTFQQSHYELGACALTWRRQLRTFCCSGCMRNVCFSDVKAKYWRCRIPCRSNSKMAEVQ